MQSATTPRATRAPRTKPSLFRRLHIHLQQMLLLRELDKLGQRANAIEAKLAASADDAHHLAQLFRFSPVIEAGRRAQRRELANITTQFRSVRQRLDNLSAELAS